MKQPAISVIIPMYNAVRYITHCIDGLLAQTFTDIEIIVVDDCSSDGSAALVKERYDGNEKVILLQQEKNGGPAPARNTGMKKACGEYITFVDCDDALVPDALEKLYTAAKDTQAEVVHTTGCLMPMAEPICSEAGQQLPDTLHVFEANTFRDA